MQNKYIFTNQDYLGKSEISSVWTFFAKFLFPLPFVIFSFSIVFSAWFGNHLPTHIEISSSQMKYLSLYFPIIFIGVPVLLCGRLKRLRLDRENLYISNYFKEVVVPIANIKEVEEHLGLRLAPTRIYFRQATSFGSEIYFIPRDTFLPWRPSLVVAELRKSIGFP